MASIRKYSNMARVEYMLQYVLKQGWLTSWRACVQILYTCQRKSFVRLEEINKVQEPSILLLIFALLFLLLMRVIIKIV